MPTERLKDLVAAAEKMDWQQVVLTGGPPCFHFEEKEGCFCGRAQRWQGHDACHRFVSLADLLAAIYE